MPTNRTHRPTLILAPIRGITDVVYRDAFACCFGGFDRAIAPYIQPRRGQALEPADLEQVAPARNNALWTVPQLLANDPEILAAALLELHEAGHVEANWNLGCPTPTVVGRKRGSGLLPDPGRIDGILTHALARTPIQLSVKIRLGYADPNEHLAVIEVLNRHPLTEVTLHARTGDQMYSGNADVARAAQALTRCRHPFVYNGDITDPDGFRAVRERLPGAAGWMIGRGALRNPFLPAILAEADTPEATGPGPALPPAGIRHERLREFHDLLFAGYSAASKDPRQVLDRMQSQWTYLAHAFESPRQVNSRVQRCRGITEYTDAAAWIFGRPR